MSNHIDINWFGEEEDHEPPGQCSETLNHFINISTTQLSQWLDATLRFMDFDNSEVSVAMVSESEIQKLNAEFRGKNQPTNVLSFPLDDSDDSDDTLESLKEIDSEACASPRQFLGDIICCPSIIKKEAEQYNMAVEKRMAHMMVHGVLHLLGMDHIDESERESMEQQEILILKQLGFSNPYIIE